MVKQVDKPQAKTKKKKLVEAKKVVKETPNKNKKKKQKIVQEEISEAKLVKRYFSDEEKI